jgi:hypothetical protein
VAGGGQRGAEHRTNSTRGHDPDGQPRRSTRSASGRVHSDLSARSSPAWRVPDVGRASLPGRRGNRRAAHRARASRGDRLHDPNGARSSAGQRPITGRAAPDHHPGGARSPAGQHPITGRAAPHHRPGSARSPAGRRPITGRAPPDHRPRSTRSPAGRPGRPRPPPGRTGPAQPPLVIKGWTTVPMVNSTLFWFES